MREKNYSISLLRMLAVISIIFCHSFEYSSSIFINKGWILKSIGNYLANSVQVFLIISGFLYGNRKNNVEKSEENPFISSEVRIRFLIKNSFKRLLGILYFSYISSILSERTISFNKKKNYRGLSNFWNYKWSSSFMVYSLYIILLFFNSLFV